MNKTIFRFLSFLAVCAMALGSYSGALASALSNLGKLQPQFVPTIYYVSTTGSDTNSGSATSPFKTFAKAVSVLQAGDTLQVLPGIYTETLVLSRSGTASTPITVIGNGAILNMQGINANGITITGSYVHVSRFEVLGAIDFGIVIAGKYDKVENNNVHDNVTKNGVGTCGLSTSWGSAIKVRVGGENTIIRNNTVFNNCGEGIAVTRGITALVENNTAYDNFSVNIYIDNSPFVTVQNNISYCAGTHLRDGNRANGIALGEEFYSGWGAQLHDILISGNTITACRTGISAYESYVGGTLTNVAILNNNIPTGERRSISLQTLANQNVLVSNNFVFNSIYLYQPAGVTVGANPLSTGAATSTSMPLPTNTIAASTFTPTSILPTATRTTAPVTVVPATVTPTSIPPTWTASPSPIPASPTFTSTSLPPTPTAVVNTPSTTTRTFDDRHAQFVYSAGWQDLNDQRAYEGSHKLTTQNGSSMTFTFTGQSFSVLYRGGPAYRQMNVYMDNVLVGTINQKASSVRFQLRWDYPGQLTAGNHTLKLVFVTANTSNGTNGSVDAIIVR